MRYASCVATADGEKKRGGTAWPLTGFFYCSACVKKERGERRGKFWKKRRSTACPNGGQGSTGKKKKKINLKNQLSRKKEIRKVRIRRQNRRGGGKKRA